MCGRLGTLLSHGKIEIALGLLCTPIVATCAYSFRRVHMHTSIAACLATVAGSLAGLGEGMREIPETQARLDWYSNSN